MSPDAPLTSKEWYSFLSTYPVPAPIVLSVGHDPRVVHVQNIVTSKYPTYGLTTLQSLALYYYLHNLDFSEDTPRERDMKITLLLAGLRKQIAMDGTHVLPDLESISPEDIIKLQAIFE